MDTKTLAILKAWLLDREDDIAWGIDDLGELSPVFIKVVGREPVYEE